MTYEELTDLETGLTDFLTTFPGAPHDVRKLMADIRRRRRRLLADAILTHTETVVANG